ncbi:MAG TPA: preprotein translocase subunit TatA [Dermatophilaceae bacterium]|nr:preprotein translocase subunit TatA [Dermatophilaceae bacterium]
MNIFDINGWELVIILVVAAFVIGPERLPAYVARLRGWVRQGRAMADTARGQLREQMGPDFDDIDWSQFDPRQYDPRRIVREALIDPIKEDFTGLSETVKGIVDEQPAKPRSRVTSYDPAQPTPWDGDAT